MFSHQLNHLFSYSVALHPEMEIVGPTPEG